MKISHLAGIEVTSAELSQALFVGVAEMVRAAAAAYYFCSCFAFVLLVVPVPLSSVLPIVLLMLVLTQNQSVGKKNKDGKFEYGHMLRAKVGIVPVL